MHLGFFSKDSKVTEREHLNHGALSTVSMDGVIFVQSEFFQVVYSRRIGLYR